MIHKYELTDLLEPTEDDKPLTLFVPDNNSFDALEGDEVFGFDSETKEFNSLTRDETIFVLKNHIVNLEAQSYSYSDLECGQLSRTANLQSIRTACRQNLKYQRGPSQTEENLARISLPNMNVCNDGIVHVVNNVVLPNLNQIL